MVASQPALQVSLLAVRPRGGQRCGSDPQPGGRLAPPGGLPPACPPPSRLPKCPVYWGLRSGRWNIWPWGGVVLSCHFLLLLRSGGEGLTAERPGSSDSTSAGA